MMKHTALLSCAALALGAGMAQAQVTDEMLANPPAGEWISYGRTQDNHRHSPLTQITPDNVKNLQLVWARGMEPGVNQSNPLVYNGVMYLVNSGDVIQAIDAKTGDLIWEHRRQLPDIATLNTQGDRKRSVALYGDKLYFVSWDNHLVALNLTDGQMAFDIDRGDGLLPHTIGNTSGPIVANGVILAGSTCQYSAVGCYVTGHDVNTGEELWRNYFIPKPGEEGDETWGNDYESRWMTGAWGQITYDPVTDLAFYGSTGVGPASETQRGTPGGTLAGTNTRFAVRPSTGEIVWRHQVLPRDNWDQECTFEMIAATTDVSPAADMEGVLAVNPNASGEGRRVLTGVPCKTGVMWQFDAETGEFLWARATNTQDLIASIEASSGLVTVNEEVILDKVGEPQAFCPTFIGGRDWAPTAFNSSTGIHFVPLNNACSEATPVDQEFSALDVYNVDLQWNLSPNKTNMGRIDAIDISTGKTLWSYEQEAALYAPLTSTESGLIFAGGTDRYFRAISQENGDVLWQTRLASIASGHPISYEIDGRQYVAIPAGGTTYAALLNGALPTKIDSVANGSAIYVFALPQ